MILDSLEVMSECTTFSLDISIFPFPTLIEFWHNPGARAHPTSQQRARRHSAPRPAMFKKATPSGGHALKARPPPLTYAQT
jgi:hypothetical protein